MRTNKRSDKEMMHLILDVANQDERIRGVIMNGSRTSPSAKKDFLQDYDIVYIVKDVEPFVKDEKWIEQFGHLLIMQKPDEIDGIWPGCKDKFTYLMQFTDWNRVDLTLINQAKIKDMPKDSQSILLLDKDNMFEKFDSPSDIDYFLKPPTQSDFFYCCNEFLWVSLSLAKGIWRKELTYAKCISDQILKEELMKLLIWYAGIKTHFEKNLGKFGKYLENYVEPEIWHKFLKTYVDADYEHMWDGCFEMCELFNILALKISTHYQFHYDEQEYRNVFDYLKAIKNVG